MNSLTVSQARERLGDLIARVAQGEGPLHLTDHGHPAGALVDLDTAGRLGYHLTGSHSATHARAHWAQVRSASYHGPQALVVESTHIAVLLGPDQARALTEPHPELPKTITWDGCCLAGPDGTEVPPGVYRVGSTIISLTREDTL